jgi:hypothetical protein
MKGNSEWYRVLEVARGLSPDPRHTFTAPDLAEAAAIETPIASGWLYKFAKWDYVEVTGTMKGNSIRPLNVHIVTKKGHACKLRADRESQLRQVLDAIRLFRKARGTKAETSAITALFKTADEMEGA